MQRKLFSFFYFNEVKEGIILADSLILPKFELLKGSIRRVCLFKFTKELSTMKETFSNAMASSVVISYFHKNKIYFHG
jgi:hypothetical protein